MSVNFPITHGVWSHVQSGLPTAKEASHYSCLEVNTLRGMVVLAGAIALAVTPLFFILDLLYLAAKAVGCVKKEEGATVTLKDKDIRAIENKEPANDVFDNAIKPEEKSGDVKEDTLPVYNRSITFLKPDEKSADMKPVENRKDLPTALPKRPSVALTPVAEIIAAHKKQIDDDKQRADGKKFFFVREKHTKGDEFVGLDAMRTLMQQQVDAFKKWANAGQWGMFSHKRSHYDWWAFPICRDSQHGYKYSLSLEDIEVLKKDKAFMDNFRTAVHLVVQSWGWDLTNNCPLDPEKGGSWDKWDVRLGKMATSLRHFGEWDLLARLQAFVKEDLYRAYGYQLEPWVVDQLLLRGWYFAEKVGSLD